MPIFLWSVVVSQATGPSRCIGARLMRGLGGLLRPSQRSNSSGDTTSTVNVMYAWFSPQNSEHTPW